MTGLKKRLGLLGLLPPAGAQPLPPSGPEEREARARTLTEAIPGSLARRHAEGWVVEREVVLPSLGEESALPWAGVTVGLDLARLAGEPRAADLPLQGAVALDVETTGLGFGADTYAFLVGLLRLGVAEGGQGPCPGGEPGRGTGRVTGARLWQGIMADPMDEPALLDRVQEELRDAPLVLTFNGRAFDLPLLAARAALHRREPSFGERPHLDLLGPCRGLFRPRLGSCALSRLQAHVLLAPRQDDVPGAAIPDLYRAFLRLGAPAAGPLGQVARHNAWDLEAVARLARRLAAALASSGPGGLVHGADWLGLGRCRRRLGDREGALRAFSEAWRRLENEGAEALGVRETPDSNSPPDPSARVETLARPHGPGGLPDDHPSLQVGAARGSDAPRLGDRRQRALAIGGDSAGEEPGREAVGSSVGARARTLAELAGQAGLEAGRLCLRTGDMEGARRLFEAMRSRGQGGLTPWVELAKLAEHRDRDFAAALSLAEDALGLLAQGRFKDERALGALIHGLRHRGDRLRRRLARLRPG